MGIAKTDKGFTIIEVSMVLAIAGLLFFGIMIGITRQVQQQRFKESVDATQSFLQQQYRMAVNVVNDRNNDDSCGTGTDRGTSSCPIIGRLIKIYEPDTTNDEFVMSAQDIIIDDNPLIDNPTYSGDLVDYLNKPETNARFLPDNNKSSYIVPWGATMIPPKDDNGTGSNVTYIALVRSPRGGELNVLKLVSDSNNVPLKFSVVDKSIKTCITSQEIVGFTASLSINGLVNTQDGVTTKFDEATCP